MNAAVLIAVVLQIGFVAIGLWALQAQVAEHIQLKVFLGVFACYLIRLLKFTKR